jgi:hypothetical protein
MTAKKPEAKVTRPRSSMVPRSLSDAVQAAAAGSTDEPWRARRRKTKKKTSR